MKKKLLVLVAVAVLLAAVAAVGGCGSSGGTSTNKPIITGLVPDTGPAGTQMHIEGLNFGTTQGNGVVHVGTEVAKVASWSDTVVIASVPTGLQPVTQPVTVLTKDGQSDYIEFSVVAKPSDQPDPKENQVETVSAAQAMANWLKQNNQDPTGWNYSVVNISEKDPTWKIDKASKAGQADVYFLFHRDAKGNWTIVKTGKAATKTALPAANAPSDIYIVPQPKPQPQPKPTPKSQPQPPPTPKQVTQLDAVKNYIQKQGGSTANVFLSVERYSTIDPTWAEGTVATNLGGGVQNVFLHKVNGSWTVAFLGTNPTYAQLVALGVPKDLAHTNTESQAIAAWIQNGHAPPGVTPTGWSLNVVKSSKADPNWEIVQGTQAGYTGTMYWLLHWDGSQWVVMDDGGTLSPQQLTAPGMPNDLF